ncbi:hypothetical protein GDO81_022467 [Engystomops pustulosus]|uniref:UPAR/Ly6 domain-containing protein n=1 Tax=Engystomops pustulosus TaxID=76066 RepID=A0AAV6Z5N0_ENGPU|nr:hypothetical protein GDO81_022467 [Engystomops pustulosus]
MSSLNVTEEPRYSMRCSQDEDHCFQYINGEKGSEFYRYKQESMVGQSSCKKANKTSSLPVVNTLLCRHCRGLLTSRCDTYVRCGPEHDACFTIISKTRYGSHTSTEILHGCTHPSICEARNTSRTYESKTLQQTKICRIPGKNNVPPPPEILCVLLCFMLLLQLV